MNFNRLKWFLGIALVFLTVLATNLIDQNNFLKMKDSVDTIYKDRLIASDIIFSMNNVVHRKELDYHTDSDISKKSIESHNDEFDDLIKKFKATKLTTEESEEFSRLKESWIGLKKVELGNSSVNSSNQSNVDEKIADLKMNLVSLSKIQIKEGLIQVKNSNKAIASIELFTNFEIFVLIFLAVVMQIIILYKRKEA